MDSSTTSRRIPLPADRNDRTRGSGVLPCCPHQIRGDDDRPPRQHRLHVHREDISRGSVWISLACRQCYRQLSMTALWCLPSEGTRPRPIPAIPSRWRYSPGHRPVGVSTGMGRHFLCMTGRLPIGETLDRFNGDRFTGEDTSHRPARPPFPARYTCFRVNILPDKSDV